MALNIRRRSWALGTLVSIGLWASGCSKDEHGHADSHGGHGHEPKNGGQLIEVGKHQFNLEVLVDSASGKLTTWVLDAHAEGYVRIEAPQLQIKADAGGGEQLLILGAVANAASGEKVGDTSQFEGSAEWVKSAKGFKGRFVDVRIRGQAFGDVAFELKPGK